jgi:hypothetical protein
MAEVSKSRLALDLDEIERQLRHSSPQPAPSRSDPLAELARIVGQEDPFRALLASEKSGARTARDADDIFIRREPSFESPYGQQGHATGQHLHGSLDDDEQDLSQDYRHYAALTAEEDAILYGQQDSQYVPAPHDPNLYFDDGRSYAEPDSAFAPLAPRRSRKGKVAVGAVFGAAVLGAIGAVTLRPGSLMGVSNGEPPVVKADTGPSKVAPENPGGMDIPNQNKQIYERASQDAQTRVVNREEQPVDLRAATRTALAEGAISSPQVRISPSIPPGTPINNIPSSLQGTSNSAVGILGEPRRVRTVSIRPDGTMIMPEEPAPSRSAAAPAAPAPAGPGCPGASPSPPATGSA